MGVMVVRSSLKNSPTLVMVILMSLRGMPPLLGIFMKFGGLYCLSGTSLRLCAYLAIWSLFGFFYYFNATVEVYYGFPLINKVDWVVILINVIIGPILFIRLIPIILGRSVNVHLAFWWLKRQVVLPFLRLA